MTKNNLLTIREMIEADSEIISAALLQQGWHNPVSQYIQYFQEILAGRRTVFVAFHDQQFAGYVTILWESDYPPFQAQGIPEIADFNVLEKYQRQGIGSKLMDAAEQCVLKRSEIVGIGVGLTQDYGAAQILYIKRGYIPDGLGISQRGQHLKQGDQIQIDHDLTLYFTKAPNPSKK